MKRLPTDDEQNSADGDCFVMAGDMAINNPDLVLCHGLVQHPEIEPLVHWHAWCETTRRQWIQFPDGNDYPVDLDICIDHSNGQQSEHLSAMYYMAGQITNVRRYTHLETARMMAHHGHYGPWHEPVLPEDKQLGDDSE